MDSSASTEFPGTGRQNATRFSIGSKAYVGLGNGDGNIIYTDLWEFNPANKTWTKKADFPGTPRAASGSFVIGNKVYVATGLCNCKDVWEYDPTTDT
ncbi:hypothetical protein HB364_05495 [Pseudoflavitalea sp. X16]|uniref:kelch repeat-containing protein n=1 Tax=Paraflavitalea devenefica TaxID=2716334 RepID=UPI001421A689|nr:kelch repeat-containing protein [Paraflavitalea devenefica]NII24521.1 hypothetical protein [Paraflavitalea devenefica]